MNRVSVYRNLQVFAALTIATMPARTASGSIAQLLMTTAKSGKVSTSVGGQAVGRRLPAGQELPLPLGLTTSTAPDLKSSGGNARAVRLPAPVLDLRRFFPNRRQSDAGTAAG